MSFNYQLEIGQTEKNRLSKIKIHFPYSREELLQEIEQEEWNNPGTINPLGVDLWKAQRVKCMHPKEEHLKLKSLCRWLASDKVKQSLIDWMFDQIPALSWEYDYNKQSMFDHTVMHSELNRDIPGFVNVLHTDYRKLVATGMIYLTDYDTPDLSTYFYDTPDRQNPLRMTTEFGDGWWHANGNNTWHEGWNRTDQYRYVILMGLTLNVTLIRNRL